MRVSSNLIPRTRRHQKRSRARLRIWIAICVGYGFALAVAYGGFYVAWGDGGVDPAAQLREIKREINESTLLAAGLSGQLAEAQRSLRASKAMGNPPDWSVLLVLVGSHLGDDVVLSACEMSPWNQGQAAVIPGLAMLLQGAQAPSQAAPALADRRYWLRLSGYGRTQTAVSRFVLRLERAKFFDEVKLIKSNREQFLGEGAAAFKIECAL